MNHSAPIRKCLHIYTAYRLHPESFVGHDEIITRGEYAAILAQEIPLDTSNAEKDPPSFSDIDGHWSEKYIEALIDAGIIDPADYPDGFHPDDPITRAEILRMLVRAEGKDEEAKNTQGHSGYDDQPDIKDEDIRLYSPMEGEIRFAQFDELYHGLVMSLE